MTPPAPRLLFISVLLCATSASAQFVENFASFPGSASGALVGPWEFVSDTLGTASAGLQSASPLGAANGQYLSVSTQHASGFNNLQFGSFLTREYTSTPSLNLNDTHVLSFGFRLDELVQEKFTHIQFDGLRNGESSWSLFMGFPAISHSTWLFGEGTGAGGALFVPIGLLPTVGHIYQVELTLRPQISTYDITLQDLSAGLAAFGSFHYRTTSQVAAIVVEEIQVNVFTASSLGDRITYSLDNVQLRAPTPVTAVPEPASYGMLAGAGLVFLILRRRRS